MVRATQSFLQGWKNNFLAHQHPIYAKSLEIQKTFLRLLHLNKLYKLSVKGKFDLVGTSVRQGTQGNKPKPLIENAERLEGTNSIGKDTRVI
jgi:hypothetical protein